MFNKRYKPLTPKVGSAVSSDGLAECECWPYESVDPAFLYLVKQRIMDSSTREESGSLHQRVRESHALGKRAEIMKYVNAHPL